VSPSQYLGPARKASGFGPSSPILGPTLRSRDVRGTPCPLFGRRNVRLAITAGYVRSTGRMAEVPPRLAIPLSEEPFDSRVLAVLNSDTAIWESYGGEVSRGEVKLGAS